MNTIIITTFRNAVKSHYGNTVFAWTLMDYCYTYFKDKGNTTMLKINSAVQCATKVFFKCLEDEVRKLEEKKEPQSKADCEQYIHCAMESAAEDTIKMISDFYSAK